MPIPLAVPIVAGVVAAGAIVLRVRAVKKAKPAGTVSAVPAGVAAGTIQKPKGAAPLTAVIKQTTTVEQAAAIAAGKPIPAAKPGAPTIADLEASLKNPTANTVSFDGITDEMLNAAHDALLAQQAGKAISAGGGAAVGQQAIVTTNDAPPSGDLIIRDAPNGNQIGGAEKNGTVTVLNANVDGVFAQIAWGGGSRLPAATGFARKAFLKLI